MDRKTNNGAWSSVACQLDLLVAMFHDVSAFYAWYAVEEEGNEITPEDKPHDAVDLKGNVVTADTATCPPHKCPLLAWVVWRRLPFCHQEKSIRPAG